jgi:ribosomal protein S18 acetylase RimI-like enzyme
MSQRDATLIVREIGADAFDRAWPIYRAVVAAGDTYSYPQDIGEADARALWTTAPTRCFLAEIDDEPVGCYMLRPNQPGLGDHVANAGYMVAPDARGRGVAAAMCEHSMQVARAAGFSAMQFNYVVASNEGAVRLWRRLGFAIVGRVPDAFRHATHGLTDILVMHRFL